MNKIVEKLKVWFVKNGKLKTGTIMVVVTILLLFLFLSLESKAETYVQVGPSIVSGEFTDGFVLIMQERFKDKYALSLGYIASQDVGRYRVQEQLIVGAERIVRGNFGNWFDNMSLSFGPYWFQNQSIVTSANLNVRLALYVDVTDRLSVILSHFSNGGTGDKIVTGQSKQKRVICSDGGCYPMIATVPWLSGPYNKGQDALLLSWRF